LHLVLFAEREFAKRTYEKVTPLSSASILLARLAVHLEYHGQGSGKITLIKALEYLWEINSYMRAYAIIVDCLNDKIKNFYSKYGFEVLNYHNGKTRMFMPMTIVGQLFQPFRVKVGCIFRPDQMSDFSLCKHVF